MSFLKRLFGGGDSAKPAAGEAKPVGDAVEHSGFTIQATPYRAEGQFQTCGIISKTIDGLAKQHHFVRADRFASEKEAADMALKKGRQIIDEQGDRVFI